MLNINKCEFTGRLTRDSVTRSTQSGRIVQNFSIAVNNPSRNSQGGWDDNTVFIQVERWIQQQNGIPVQQFLKGEEVYVFGRLKGIDSYQARDGGTAANIVISAQEVKSVQSASQQAAGMQTVGYGTAPQQGGYGCGYGQRSPMQYQQRPDSDFAAHQSASVKQAASKQTCSQLPEDPGDTPF